MAEKTMTLTRAWLWPSVANRRFAQSAIQEAFWVCVGISILTLVVNLVVWAQGHHQDFDPLISFAPAMIALCALGIRARSRVAALAALVLFVLSRLTIYSALRTGNLALDLFLGLALFHGVRGTVAFHRFPALPAGIPTMAQSFQSMKTTGSPDNSPPARD